MAGQKLTTVMDATNDRLPQLYIGEIQNKAAFDNGRYADRFEAIDKLILTKGGVTIVLGPEEARNLYYHLKPALSG